MSIAEAAGRFLRRYRQMHGLTMDSVATAGREFGATWSLSSVQAIEAGKAAPTLPTLLTLALVLGRLSGEPVRLADLVSEADLIDRPFVARPDQPVRRTWLERVLSGVPVELHDVDYVHVADHGEGSESDDSELAALASNIPLTPQQRREQVDALWEAMNEPPDADSGRSSASKRHSLAESRAAKKLGVQPLLLQQHAVRLWGHSLETEALHRAGADSTPQARGRVTRILVDELRASIEGVR